ncbi:hypothetical protein C8R45DRAFT_944163 [Mycena sanguinolenta]|nr:hypothetical protein C8R45DRAFT_944163 [Mycena sanguinolenta]
MASMRKNQNCFKCGRQKILNSKRFIKEFRGCSECSLWTCESQINEMDGTKPVNVRQKASRIMSQWSSCKAPNGSAPFLFLGICEEIKKAETTSWREQVMLGITPDAAVNQHRGSCLTPEALDHLIVNEDDRYREQEYAMGASTSSRNESQPLSRRSRREDSVPRELRPWREDSRPNWRATGPRWPPGRESARRGYQQHYPLVLWEWNRKLQIKAIESETKTKALVKAQSVNNRRARLSIDGELLEMRESRHRVGAVKRGRFLEKTRTPIGHVAFDCVVVRDWRERYEVGAGERREVRGDGVQSGNELRGRIWNTFSRS